MSYEEAWVLSYLHMPVRSMKREEISTFLLAYGRRLYQLWVPPDAVTESLVIALGVRLEQAR